LIDLAIIFLDGKRDAIESTEDENDLLPPPMSLSLPELFSAQHQIVEIMREAVSSTELLHERAMERFYRAVAAEEASEITKQKTQLERQTGESDVDATQKSSLRRRLSNSGVTTQNLIASWQARKNRRRASEGQTDVIQKTMKLLSPTLLLDVEARSDPNLPSETTIAGRRSNDHESLERLRRWHEANVLLLEEMQPEKSILADNGTEAVTSSVNRMESQPIAQITTEEIEEEELNSIETSEESSEEISSADSEDLKLLKSRILARQIIDEEDTYHPRGKPVSYVEPEMQRFAYDRPTLEISPPPSVRAVTPVSPTNMVPKSILKKPREDMTSLDNLDKAFPPEKPIRKSLPQEYPHEEKEKTNFDIEEKILDVPSMSETLKTPTMSESDTDSILSAAEAAKSRRLQSKLRSMSSEDETAEAEARLAVVNQYTEIVREHSSHSRHSSAASSRRSSFSEDHDQKHRMQEKVAPRPIDKQDEASRSKSKNEIDRQKRNSQVSDSKREIINSRGTTPVRDTIIAKEKHGSKPSSRDQSPAVKRRERISNASSRSSSKSRNRTPSRERSNRQSTRNNSNEQGTHRSRVPSRPSSRSRSSSRERFGTTESVKSKIERLQRALENKYRAIRKESDISKENTEESVSDRAGGKQLALEAKITVRSTVSYITDLTLLMAAMYVYFFKKETLAVPFIILLLYRKVQEEIHRWMPRRWWRSTKKR
jgi:hypothetical protein